MKRFGVVAKPRQEDLAPTVRQLIGWLKERGVETFLDENLSRLLEPDRPALLNSETLAQQNLVIVLGGDGTLLRAARLVGLSDVPLLGVNLGGLGFLTAVTTEELFPTLETILKGEHAPEERMRLGVKVVRQGKTIFECVVLNDAVLTKAALARIVDLTASVGGKHLTDYRADGLIIATPTGSTAYNLSAGGPILQPTLSAMILTPICPFTLSNRPLVVSEEAEVTVRLGRNAEDVYLTCDGQEGLPLLSGDLLVINRTPGLKLFPSPFHDHFAILRTKLGWGVAGGANCAALPDKD
jgi:NAD+ kinase